MAKRVAFSRVLSLVAGILAITLPVGLQAEGISLLADFEYFYTNEKSIAKDTGIVTDTESSRFSQLYQLDIGRFVYPNVFFNLGGYFEQNDSDTTLDTPLLPELSIENTETTIRPYVEVNLRNPLYKVGLAYRKRDTETSGTLRIEETVTVDEYNANLNWRPVEFPLLNINYQRVELQDEPLTFDATRDSLNLVSKYIYKDFFFHYAYNRLDNFNNIEDSGNLSQTHNGTVRFDRGFDYRNNSFVVQASAKYISNTIEFTGSNAADSVVDTPVNPPGSPFYILDDVPPASNEPSDLIPVDPGHPLTNVNIGRNGGFNPVSGGLGFNTPTEVDTVYILLSNDLDSFPNLATPAQVAAVAPLFTWQVYSSNDPVELNWILQPFSSVIYNRIDNRFEIRLAATVSARQIKITTVPLTIVAPGEIRYDSISGYTTVTGNSGEKPENFDQYYTFGLQWRPNSKTVIGYEGYYRNQDARHTQSERTSWTNGLFFRHTINPIFSTDGRVYRNDRTRKEAEDVEEGVEHLYSLSLRANYLETLSQTLTYSGARTNEPEGSSTTNSVVLRTIADLYTGWSVNLDFGYAFNTLLNDVDQTVRNVRVGTIIEPNRRITISLDYTLSRTEETDQVEFQTEYGTFQILWALTKTMNTFFRYNFRNQEGETKTSTSLREFNINWAPFPDGTLQFALGYNETKDFAEREIKTISPTVNWQVARGVFFDLRYNTGTIESPTESSDLDSLIGKLRIFY